MKNKKTKKYHIVETASKSNSKIVERVNTLNTQIHDRSLSVISTGTAIKSDSVLWA
jgi:hypothetical protein